MNVDAGLTRIIAEFALDAVPVRTHESQIVDALLDTVGVAIAAREDAGSRMLHDWAGAQGTTGESTVWSTGGQTSAAMAALLNGTDGHVLDYDDVSPTMPMHPSTVLLPALLALAEARDIHAAGILEAYDVGAAVFRAVSEHLCGNEHYAAGWHITATVGRIAATAASIRLLRLDIGPARHALGIVSSHVSGSRLNFGSMTKPLHAGVAARDAVFAVELAERGFTANPAELEAPGGFFDRFGFAERATDQGADLLRERLHHWLDGWVTDWSIKSYPACYATHRAIDALLEIRERAGADLERNRPREIRVSTFRHGTDALLKQAPVSAQQAKFNMPYVAATAILTGDVRLRDFTPEAFEQTERHAIARRVVLEELDQAPFGDPEARFWSTVQVTLDDGDELRARVDATRGDSSNPLTRQQLLAKFMDCALVAGVEQRQGEMIAERLIAIGSGGSVRSALALLRELNRHPAEEGKSR